MRNITIACVLPIWDDPTSYYRGITPLTRLCQKHPEIKIVFPPNNSWASLIGADLLFLQRPANPDHFVMLMQAKEMGIPVWVDMDDDNLAVPKDNPTYAQYSQMPIKEAVLKLARFADALTVTTPFMKKKYGIYNKKTILIPNALDDKLLSQRVIIKPPREKKFLWRGTASHHRNLMSVGLPLLNLAQKYPDWKFTFFGMDPIDLTDRIRNHEVVPQVPLMNFFKVMGQIHASVLYYPLNSNDHSQARSHISWIEGTYANTPVLAYKNEEFTRPGLLNYTSQVEFEDMMDKVARNEIDLDKCVNDSWDFIMENYLLSKVNEKRLEVINSLVS